MAPAGGSDRHDRELADRRRVRVTLSSRRDRLTAIGRRRSDVAKTELYWGRGAGAPIDQKFSFRNRRARESAGASISSEYDKRRPRSVERSVRHGRRAKPGT